MNGKTALENSWRPGEGPFGLSDYSETGDGRGSDDPSPLENTAAEAQDSNCFWTESCMLYFAESLYVHVYFAVRSHLLHKWEKSSLFTVSHS